MENLQKKSIEKINQQVSQVDDLLEERIGLKEDIVSEKEVAELKENHPLRYQIYVDALRALRSGSEMDMEESKTVLNTLNNLDDYIYKHNSNEDSRILRDRQATVFEDLRSEIEKGTKEGYLKLPTGTGKTVLFSQIVKAMDLRSLIVVPSKILVNQTGKRIEQFTDLDYGKYFTDIKETDNDVTVITYQSLINAVESGEIAPKDYGLLILDEIHKGLGEKTTKAIDQFNGFKIGLTATPDYSANRKVSNILEKEIHSMTTVEGIQEGLINKFRSIFAYTDTDISDVPIDRYGNYDALKLEKAINNQGRNLSAVELYKDMFNDKTAVAYCGGVSHAKELSELFNEHGVSSAVVSGETSTEEREIIFKKFHSGEIRVLCNAKVLIEGFDEPKASVALNLHPTQSRVDAEQRGGRVLRLDPDDSEKWAYVVDFIDASKEQAVLYPEVAGATIAYPNPNELDNASLKDTNPEEIDSLKIPQLKAPTISGLKVIVDAHEMLEISQQNEFLRSSKEILEAPEGWMYANQISKEYSINHSIIVNYAKTFKAENPDWFATYQASIGSAEHYAPELVQKILDKYLTKEGLNPPPDDWVSYRNIQMESGKSKKRIEQIIDLLAGDFENSTGTFIFNRKEVSYVSPKLRKAVLKYIEETTPQKGWMTPNGLRRNTIASGEPAIKRVAEKYRESNPEYFKSYPSSRGLSEFYAPELIDLLVDELGSKGEKNIAPKGWKTISTYCNENGYDYSTVKKISEKYTKSHRGWVAEYDGVTKKAIHLHPDLMKKIDQWYEKKNAILEAPEGWENSYRIALDLGRDTVVVKKISSRYRKTNPEWFKEYKAGKYHTAEYYDPELVKIIKQEIKG